MQGYYPLGDEMGLSGSNREIIGADQVVLDRFYFWKHWNFKLKLGLVMWGLEEATPFCACCPDFNKIKHFLFPS